MPKNATPRRIDLRTGATTGIALSSAGGAGGGVGLHDHATLYVPLTRVVTAGDGLDGGGALSSNIIIDVDATVVRTTRLVAAGAGLTGGGDLSANRTLALATPGTLNDSTSNSATAPHTHAVTASADVSAGGTALLKSTVSGGLTLATLTAGAKVTTPLIDSTATLTLTPGTYAVLSDGKRLRTSTYTSGFAGAGFQLDQGVTTAGNTFLELDNLSVRGTLSAYELLIRQIRATNGAIFVSSVMKVASYNLHSGTEGVAGATYRLYPDTTLSDNVFLVGDLVRAQRFTGSGTYKSDLQITYVDPGNAYCIGQAITAKGPGAGYEYVRLGSASDANRRGGLYLSSDDTGAPFIDIFNDVDSHSDWNTAGVIKVRVGKLDGVTGGTNEYGLWAAGKNSGDYLSISPTNGFKLIAGNGIVSITDDNGIALSTTATASYIRSYSFQDTGTRFAALRGYFSSSSGDNYIQAYVSTSLNRKPNVELWANGSAAYPGRIYLLAGNDTADAPAITLEGATSNLKLHAATITIEGLVNTFTMVNGSYLATDEVRARDSGGLILGDDSGNLGLFVKDGGFVGVGTSSPTTLFHTIAPADGAIAAFAVNDGGDSVGFSLYGYTSDYGIAYLQSTVMFYATSLTPNLNIVSSNTNGEIRLSTGGFNADSYERMRVTKSGTIFNGDASALYRFRVNGYDKLSVGYTASGQYVSIPNDPLKFTEQSGIWVGPGDSSPSATHSLATGGQECCLYVKNDRLILAFRDATDVYRYFYFDMTQLPGEGGTALWKYTGTRPGD